ncbi:hypothetical protein SAMN04488061_0405 [Filomicrobium insigne]|uniref:VOC domain-containing protein n=1 Tax=Filomicrobium insigne TaxID=418854 RepID=A0A1H0H6I2_9HYPH|nr:VOC family protein [Filomicrobium insigne]SDO14759.1 hypothetical protein SAMN04488061_0405 [Filomicrobium insigne]
MSNPIMIQTPQNGARLFKTLNLRQHVKLVASMAFAGLVLACAPAQAVEATTNTTPNRGSCSGVGFIWWSELLAPETEKLTDFYSKVMGWNTKVVDADDQTQEPSSPEDRYTIFLNGNQEVAGLMRANHPVAPHTGLGWFTYMEVEDVAATIEKVEANGGTILRDPMETENGDVIAVVNDPMGNVFGIVTPAQKPNC